MITHTTEVALHVLSPLNSPWKQTHTKRTHTNVDMYRVSTHHSGFLSLTPDSLFADVEQCLQARRTVLT